MSCPCKFCYAIVKYHPTIYWAEIGYPYWYEFVRFKHEIFNVCLALTICIYFLVYSSNYVFSDSIENRHVYSYYRKYLTFPMNLYTREYRFSQFSYIL